MEDRRRRLSLREVVAALAGEMDVRTEGGGPDAVRDRLAGAHEVEQMVRGDVCHDERQPRRGESAPGTPHVEIDQRDPPASFGLGEQDPCDQEAREDEEDVDSDEAARQEGHAGVREDDEQDGERSESLDVVSMRHLHLPGRP
jgi:hypothetical protein